MNSLGLVLLLFLGQSPAEMEKILQEFDEIDCAQIYGSTKNRCLTQCASLKNEPDGKEAMGDCIKECQEMIGGAASRCEDAKKMVEDFKKKSPQERERILREAAHGHD